MHWSTGIMGTKLATVRDLAPYYLVEPLLPGGTVLALLLWLLRAFVTDRFAGVRQYLHTPRPRRLRSSLTHRPSKTS